MVAETQPYLRKTSRSDRSRPEVDVSHADVMAPTRNALVLGLTRHLSLFIIFLVGLHIRYLYHLVLGGAAPDYLVWANEHHFGGITWSYLVMARGILAGHWASVGMIYPPGYPTFLALADGLTGSF